MQATRTQLGTNGTVLDGLISRLKEGRNEDASALLIEHLQTAYAYLHGAMPSEYFVNLEMARKAARGLSDLGLKSEIEAAIGKLLQCEAASATSQVEALAPPAHPLLHTQRSLTAADIADYFHERWAGFGAFYPNKHAVATFTSFEVAARARQIVYNAGFPGAGALLVSGEEFGKFLNDFRASQSLTSKLLVAFSQFLDTQARLVDRYLDWAHEGCAFLIVFCPTEEAADLTSELLRKVDPIAMHWFTAGYIKRLDLAP